MTPEEIAADIQERVIAFLEARGGYVASASERELIALLVVYGNDRARQERERMAVLCVARARAIQDARIGVPHSGEDVVALLDMAAAIRAVPGGADY